MSRRNDTSRAARALALALALTLMLLASVAVMWLEIGHHCSGEDCAVCGGILSLRALLNHWSTLLLVLLLCRYAIDTLQRVLHTHPTGFARATPVSLRTRMND